MTEPAMKIWVGCLACYNDGRLVGEWFDAVDGGEVTLADVHGGTDQVRQGCEEIWVFDHEHVPVSGEMSPHEAAEWGRALFEVPDHQRAALCAWVESGDYVAEGTGDLPSISDFEERFVGEWESFRDYAEDLADEIGLLRDVPEEIARYFDWEAWTRDLAYDFTVEDAPRSGVFVFRSL